MNGQNVLVGIMKRIRWWQMVGCVRSRIIRIGVIRVIGWLLWDVVWVKPMIASCSIMPKFIAHLALNIAARTSTTTATVVSVTATATIVSISVRIWSNRGGVLNLWCMNS